MEETKEIIDVEYEELLSDMPRDINTITTEILLYKNQAGEAILEIGKRLIEVKAQLDHGEWLDYLKERVDVSVRTAQTMMQLAKEYSSNAQTFALLGSQKALKLLTLPAAEREEFVAQNDVADMSVRQLDEAIKAQKAAEKERDYWENEAKTARQEMEEQLSEQQCVYDTDMAKAQQELHDAAARAENNSSGGKASRKKPPAARSIRPTPRRWDTTVKMHTTSSTNRGMVNDALITARKTKPRISPFIRGFLRWSSISTDIGAKMTRSWNR